jgi:hypothetical protein
MVKRRSNVRWKKKAITRPLDYYYRLVRNWYCVEYFILGWLRTKRIQRPSPLLLNEIIKI